MNPRILHVDDDPDIRLLISASLREFGYVVATAGTNAEALELAKELKFDLSILDVKLPDGSGIDLMRKLNSERPVFGIALTGFGMEKDIRKSHEAGFQHHLVKPIDLNKLDSLIQQGAAAVASA